MAEITLNDLKKSRQTASQADEQQESDAAKKQTVSFSPEERKKIEELKSQIDITDSQMLMQYGTGAKQNIADFSENILSNVRSKDSGEIGALMTDLVAKVKGLDFESLQQEKGLMGLIKKGEARLKRFMGQFEKLNVQIDSIEGRLDEARMGMLKDIGMFDTLYQKNLEYFKQLQLYITAGEEKIAKMRNVTLPGLQKEAALSDDPMNAQLIKDFEDTVNQFEKKVHDLKISKTIAIQTAPQIKLIQNNDKLLADKIQTAVQDTIPLWKSQMVMALGLYKQQETLKLQRDITDAANELLLKNSEKLKQNTVDTARESERGVVDIETLKKVNENLISTIKETVQIQKEGHEKRVAAEAELVKIEGEIRSTLLEQQNGK